MPRSIVTVVIFCQFDNRESDERVSLTEIVGRWNSLRALVVVGVSIGDDEHSCTATRHLDSSVINQSTIVK